MKHLMPALALFYLMTSIASAAAQSETLNFEMPLNWIAVHTERKIGHYSVEYLRQGDDPVHPKERFSYQNGILRGKRTPDEEFNKLKADGEQRCPGTTKWNEIQVDETSVLYESQSQQCGDFPALHVISRIIHGKHNFFALIFISIGEDLPPETRTKWIGILQGASIDTVAKGDKAVGAEDVDATIPFEMDKVMAALKLAMESVKCNVTDATAVRVECKRPRNTNGNEGGYGGESVTALLEAQGDKTHIRITTGKGFYGRLGKQNWSMAVFEALKKDLEPVHP